MFTFYYLFYFIQSVLYIHILLIIFFIYLSIYLLIYTFIYFKINCIIIFYGVNKKFYKPLKINGVLKICILKIGEMNHIHLCNIINSLKIHKINVNIKFIT